MQLPTRAEVRARIQELSVAEKKVLGGMIVVMIHDHTRVKQREFIAENFTRLAVPALQLDADGEVDADLDAVQAFVDASMGRVLDLAYPLFALVAEDMRGKMAAGQGHSLADATAQAMGYFEP
jgi:hypothetical protein